MSDDIWEVFAVRYAEHQRKAAENYIGGDPHDVLQPLDYFVWVIRNDKRTFLVDTGFDQPVGTKRGRTVITPVDEGAEAARRRSRQGRGRHHQPHALRPLRQRRPVPARPLPRAGQGDAATAPAAACATSSSASPTRRTTWSSMVRKLFAGRVTFHDGVSELAPGITLHHIGGHAMGLQSIRVKTKRGFVMLAADAVHLYPHLDEARIFPTTYNLAEVLEGYETLKRLASSRHHIVPGHDPAVMKLYPPASDRR